MVQAQLRELEQIFNDPAAAAVARKLLAAVPGEFESQATGTDRLRNNRPVPIASRAEVSEEEWASVKDHSLHPERILDTLVREGYLHGAYYWGIPVYCRPHQY